MKRRKKPRMVEYWYLLGIECESKDLNKIEKGKMLEYPLGNRVHREFYGKFKIEP